MLFVLGYNYNKTTLRFFLGLTYLGAVTYLDVVTCLGAVTYLSVVTAAVELLWCCIACGAYSTSVTAASVCCSCCNNTMIL